MWPWSSATSSSASRDAGAKASASYGTPEHAEALERPFEWHQRGELFQLLLTTIISVGGQYAALGVITLTVYTSNALFVKCDSRQQPIFVALACECTKSSMRSFVLLAMVISLLIALRQIARQRLYYVMLRRGVMLDFETVSPIHDPLFILLTVCLAISLSHCFIVAWQFHHDEKSFKDFMVFINTMVTRYLAHSCVFLAFLATAYDTENQLLPLSKYVEEDPQAAKCLMHHMVVISEDAASKAVENGLHLPSKATSQQVYEALVKAAQNPEGSKVEAGTSLLERADQFLSKAKPDQYAKFVQEMWPARLLLDPRLQDEDSRRFKKVWYFISGFSLPLTLFVFIFFLRQTRIDITDVENGQIEDLGGVGIAVVYAIYTFHLLTHVWTLLFRPAKGGTSDGS